MIADTCGCARDAIPSRYATFEDIDWSRTRAYALGLNGLYINVRGREASGIVDPGTRERSGS